MAEMRYDDRVAIVTGGARGLGRAYAHLLAAGGAKVVVNDIGAAMTGEGVDAGPADTVVNEIKAAGGEAVACTDTVATEQGGKAIVEAALDHYGRVDILVHNAGNVRRGAIEEMSLDDFRAVLDVHLFGGFHLVRQAFPVMKKAGYGRFVIASSAAGIYGNLTTVNYTAAKMGLVGLSNVIAVEGASAGIKSNCIVPGALTRMADGAKNLDVSKFPPTMQPEMVAPVVGYLAHEACEVSGELFLSFGGRVARIFTAEAVGVHRDEWSVQDVADNLPQIRDTDGFKLFPVVTGYPDHLNYSLEFAHLKRPPE